MRAMERIVQSSVSSTMRMRDEREQIPNFLFT